MKLYRRHIATGQFDNAADYPNGAPFEAGTGFEWVEGDPSEGAVVYTGPVPLDKRIAAAFGALPEALQIKYDSEVTRAAIYFQWQNWTMLGVVIAQAEAKLILPDEQAVKDILDAAKAELAGI